MAGFAFCAVAPLVEDHGATFTVDGVEMFDTTDEELVVAQEDDLVESAVDHGLDPGKDGAAGGR